MPHLRFRGFEEIVLRENALGLLPALAEKIGCPEDWFTMEIVATSYLTQPPLPMIEVLWFTRGQEVQDQVATLLDEAAKGWGSASPTLLFHPLEKENYYEEGRHF